MKNPQFLSDTYNIKHDMEAEQERSDGIKYQIRAAEAKLRANEKQVGGDHYKNMAIEPWDVIDTWSSDQRIGAYRAGALKYIMRMGSKDMEVQEIGKAIHYLEKLLEILKEPK